MVASNQIVPGMTLSLEDKIFRVESAVKVTVPKGVPFIKTKLRNLVSDEVVEKSFKMDQDVQEVSLTESVLEYLYAEGKDYLFLDINTLDKVHVSGEVIGEKVDFLKEGVEVMALLYGKAIFSIELPQFVELMVVKTEESSQAIHVANSSKIGVLETGAQIEVPLFIESGDIIKVDTQTKEFIQRV